MVSVREGLAERKLSFLFSFHIFIIILNLYYYFHFILSNVEGGRLEKILRARQL